MDERVEANRRMWDERVPLHVGSRFYDVAGWKAGNRNHLQAPYEDGEIGPLDGRRVCHLQCHFGMDTLTLARRGATVVGVDFSPISIRSRTPSRGRRPGTSGRARCSTRHRAATSIRRHPR